MDVTKYEVVDDKIGDATTELSNLKLLEKMVDCIVQVDEYVIMAKEKYEK